jgi:hypothetical protein
VRYTDGRGRRQRLTREQVNYLLTVRLRGGLDCGWGGLSATRTVRLLEERGLITLQRGTPGSWPRWRVTSLTRLGESVAERWVERRPRP